MSQPPSGAEFWTKRPTLNVEPTVSGPIGGGLVGQLVAVVERVMQTRPTICAFTVRPILVAVVVSPSGEPATIRTYDPGGVDPEVLMVRTLLPVGFKGLLEKLHTTPVGRGALQDRVTGGEVPLVNVAVIVTVPELPCVTLTGPLFDSE